MNHVEQLWLFFALVFGIVVLPGLDMAFVLGSTLAGGRRRGFAALAGIVAGGVCHVVMTALGISVLLKWIPGAFNALLLAGALYIAWIGLSLMRSDAAPAMRPDAPRRSHAATFRQGMLTCLLNPKAYLFTLAVFPQFLRGGGASVAPQMLAMAAITSGTQLAIYGGLALAAGRAGRWLRGNPATQQALGRGVGALLVLAAAWTAMHGLMPR
jgi:threonine/homoserine/homoserine lactone efflux protein